MHRTESGAKARDALVNRRRAVAPALVSLDTPGARTAITRPADRLTTRASVTDRTPHERRKPASSERVL